MGIGGTITPMSTIRIVDSVQGEIISANPIVTSGFGKYLKGLPAQLLAGTDFVGQLRQSLTLVQPGQSGFRLAFERRAHASGAVVI